MPMQCPLTLVRPSAIFRDLWLPRTNIRLTSSHILRHGLRQQPRPSLSVIGRIPIDGIQNSFGHRDIDPANLDSQRRLVDRNDGPSSSFEFGITLVLVQLAGRGNGFSFVDQSFQMQFDGFLGHDQRFVQNFLPPRNIPASRERSLRNRNPNLCESRRDNSWWIAPAGLFAN